MGRRPVNTPASTTTNPWVRLHIDQPSANPIAMTRSGRYPSANPARTPAAHHEPQDPLARAREAKTTAHRPRARPPCHASADRPIGVRTKKLATMPAPAAATCPDTRANAYSAAMMARCWSSPKVRWLSRLSPKMPNHSASTSSEAGP
jgi:hypothetical protein